MSTMALFYTQLNHGLEVHDPYLQGLRQLTIAHPDQLATLNVGWETWTVEAA